MKTLTLKQFGQKLNGIKKRLNTGSIGFSDLTKEAVRIVWNADIGDISGVNKTIEVAREVKGFNDKTLIKYYKKCVPFTFDKETGLFTNKNKQTAEKMKFTWEKFIEENEWTDFTEIKVKAPYEFKPEKLVNTLSKAIDKAEAEQHLTVGNLLHLQTMINQMIEDRLQYETDTPAIDNELADLLKQSEAKKAA